MTEHQGRDGSLRIERVFDAPVDVLWRMWTDPEHFAAWYGPAGAAIPVANIEPRVGGRRLVCMEVKTPDGPMRMWFTGEYREVVAPRRLVYTESIANEDGEVLSTDQAGLPAGHPTVTEVTVELADVDGRTRMVMTHLGIPSDSPGAIGWTMAFDKLENQLVSRSS